MNELIKVTINENDEQLVSGRELHQFLGVKTRYNDWFERMTGYGFVENSDFTAITQKRVTAQGNQTEYVDHALKLDMAKEISMIQRSEKGKQARQYFLQVEKAWNNPEMVVQRALQIQTRKVEALKLENKELKPKALFADAVDASQTSILIGDLAKLIKQNGVNIGQNRLFQWMRDNGFLISRRGDSYNMPTQRSLEMNLIELEFTRGESGSEPKLGQFTTSSMTPFTEQLKTAAAGFAGETGLTLDDLGFVSDNPSSVEAIKASHENLRLAGRKAQRSLGSGFLNVAYVSACLRDGFAYNRSQFVNTKPKWEPLFEADANTLTLIGDGAIKLNQAIEGYITAETIRDLTGIKGGSNG